jgi:endonuclease/exonuclease/phosphatase family metal-dependent hydrolase
VQVYFSFIQPYNLMDRTLKLRDFVSDKILKYLIIGILALICACFEAGAQIKVMSFNIRYDNNGDGINQWSNRKEHVSELVRYHGAEIVGMQEVLINQLRDVHAALPEMAWIGRGRDDGKEAGEFSPVLYNKNRFTLLKTETFWLSDSSSKVGFGWDAVCRRVVTYGLFKDKKSGKEFYFFNTHFDHRGQVARRESAKLVLKKIAEIAGKKPVILTGDFNARPDSEPIRILVDEQNPNRLTDSEKITKSPHYGPFSTVNGFKAEAPDVHIDYIFVKNGLSCLKHATHTETWEGRFPSDHFPVSATLVLP